MTGVVMQPMILNLLDQVPLYVWWVPRTNGLFETKGERLSARPWHCLGGPSLNANESEMRMSRLTAVVTPQSPTCMRGEAAPQLSTLKQLST